jgi:hypothetical protein
MGYATSVVQDATYYFTIDDSQKNTGTFSSPEEIVRDGIQTLMPAGGTLNLLKWVRHNGSPQTPSEPYNRVKHFGPWINDPTDTTCYNTRAKVLIRDSDQPVTFKPTNHCVVEDGHWEDPYTATLKTTVKEVQIDHVVPLKNAYQSGAWSWPSLKRCLYANYMGNNYHLLSVDGHENMGKGDNGPDKYLPPNSRFVCQYLQDWLRIKTIWQMSLTASEALGVRGALQQYHCTIGNASMTRKDLEDQRVRTLQMQEICKKPATN